MDLSITDQLSGYWKSCMQQFEGDRKFSTGLWKFAIKEGLYTVNLNWETLEDLFYVAALDQEAGMLPRFDLFTNLFVTLFGTILFILV